jgi:hypothetical protein
VHDQPAAALMPADTPTSPDHLRSIAGHLHNEPGLPY